MTIQWPRRMGSLVSLALVLSLTPRAIAEKQIVKLLNQCFGKTLEEMRREFGTTGRVEPETGRFVTWATPVFVWNPGIPAYTESTTVTAPSQTTGVLITTPGGVGPSGEPLPS